MNILSIYQVHENVIKYNREGKRSTMAKKLPKNQKYKQVPMQN